VLIPIALFALGFIGLVGLFAIFSAVMYTLNTAG
jgi:hypothetical protein